MDSAWPKRMWFSIIWNISAADGIRPVSNFDHTGTSVQQTCTMYIYVFKHVLFSTGACSVLISTTHRHVTILIQNDTLLINKFREKIYTDNFLF